MDGSIAGRLLCLISILLLSNGVEAQEKSHYLPIDIEQTRYHRELRSNYELFLRSDMVSGNLYDELTLFSFSSIARDRSLIAPGKDESLWAGIGLEHQIRWLSRRLYNYPKSDIEPLESDFLSGHTISTHLAADGYLAGLRYSYCRANDKGWSVALEMDSRLGNDLYVEGVGEYSLSGGLRLGRKWRSTELEILALVNGGKRTPLLHSTREAFELRQTSYYNPSWGYCGDRVRSSRTSKRVLQQTLLALSHHISNSTTLNLSASFSYGYSAKSRLGWFDCATPQPDHYRSMPSYYSLTNPEAAELLAEEWREGNTRYTQIDWDELIARNRASDGEALYIEQQDVERSAGGEFALYVKSQITTSLDIRCGIRGDIERKREYMEVEDLLGADYHTDLDYYLIDDNTYHTSLQNNLRNPSRRVKDGDRFGYDYALSRYNVGAFTEVEYLSSPLMLSLKFEVGYANTYRRGYYEKELFAGSGSLGRSKSLRHTPYILSFAMLHKPSTRSKLTLEASLSAAPPQMESLFLQPEYNNRSVENPKMEHRAHLTLGYGRYGGKIDFFFSAFAYARWNNQRTRARYDDLMTLYCDEVVERISTYRCGVSGAARFYITPHLALGATLMAQMSGYIENPIVTLYDDRNNTILDYRSQSYMEECRVASVPHLESTIELRYSKKGWGASLDAEYAGFRYIQPDYARRTLRVAQGAAESKEAYDIFMKQESLEDSFRVGLRLWRSLQLGASRLRLLIAVDNILGDDSTPYSGYEPSRLRQLKVGSNRIYRPQDSRYIFSSPRTFYLSLSLYL